MQISLFGSLRIRAGDGRTAALPTRRSAELFAYLLLSGGSTFPRVDLAELFWPDLPGDRGRRALNTELWRLAQALREIGMDVDRALPHGIADVGYVATPGIAVDVDALKSAIRVVRAVGPSSVDAGGLALVEVGVAAYRGDLLENVYADWCLLPRENLRAHYTEALEFLVAAKMAREDWVAALRYGHTLLAIDPFMEHIHRAIMHCHFRNGDRPLALRQYAICEEVLRRELDVAPMDETRNLLETLLAVPRRPEVRPVFPAYALRQSAGSPANRISLALADMKAARQRLARVAHDLRRDLR